ncbi:MAG: hypothetical protein V4545_06765 [Pseudomonadota bacterium]
MSTSLTVEESVALMINMDFIPDGETVLSMTDAFLEEATVEYENASGNDKYQLKALENRMNACANRHNLALMLKKSLFEDAVYTEETLIECDDDSTDENPLVTLESLTEWAFDRFGIVIPNKKTLAHENLNPAANTKSPDWDDVTIKIYAHHKLGYSIGSGNFKRTSFIDIGLMGKRKVEPNEIAFILIGLSKKIKYPVAAQISQANKTAIAKLRRSLEKLTGLSGDSFLPFNKTDGYRPKFKLVDDRKNAEVRAEKEAIHINIDSLNYEADKLLFKEENDEASRWLKENHK